MSEGGREGGKEGGLYVIYMYMYVMQMSSLLEENSSLLQKLQAQEEDFKLQNKTLMEELNKVCRQSSPELLSRVVCVCQKIKEYIPHQRLRQSTCKVVVPVSIWSVVLQHSTVPKSQNRHSTFGIFSGQHGLAVVCVCVCVCARVCAHACVGASGGRPHTCMYVCV